MILLSFIFGQIRTVSVLKVVCPIFYLREKIFDKGALDNIVFINDILNTLCFFRV